MQSWWLLPAVLTAVLVAYGAGSWDRGSMTGLSIAVGVAMAIVLMWGIAGLVHLVMLIGATL